MMVFYVDEAGCLGTLPTATSPIQPVFTLAGVILQRERLKRLQFRTAKQTVVSGTRTRLKTVNGARSQRCRICCNTSATAIIMAESKSAARLLATPVPFRHRLFLLGDLYSPVNNPGMRELKDTGVLLLGFLPWLLFLFFSGHSMESLERISWVCLAASLTFGFGELRSGYILQWGTLCFFTGCVVFVGLLHVVWVATHMDLLANASLAGIIWATLFAGRPFALQYARKDLPKERWNDPRLLEGCRFITLVWAMLMSVSVGISVYRRIPVPQASEQIYFAISLATIASGVIFTTLFKRQKRLQREKLARSDSLS